MLGRIMAAVIVIFSLLACGRLPAGDPPNADLPAVNITPALPGASPEIVATSVSAPLERQLSTLAGVRSFTSSSRLAETSITIQFETRPCLDAPSNDRLAATQDR